MFEFYRKRIHYQHYKMSIAQVNKNRKAISCSQMLDDVQSNRQQSSDFFLFNLVFHSRLADYFVNSDKVWQVI